MENKYKPDPVNIPDLQTTANFKKALLNYQEVIVNKSRLRNVQIRFLQVGDKYKKDPLQDCIQHMHRWNKVFNFSMNLPPGLLAVPGKMEKMQWFFMAFCQPHRAAFQAASHGLDTMTVEQVTKFMQV